MSLRSSGAPQAAKVVKDVTRKSPTRASKYQSALKLSTTPIATEVSNDEALALIIGSKLSKGAYQNIRNLQKKVGATFLPSYEKVLQAKVRCYPSDVTITETRAEVKLQALLDHISARLLQVQHDVIKKLSPQTVSKLRFILKWGCDGSSSQNEYKQKFSDADSSDANVFLTSVVPLQLIAIDIQSNKEIVVWKNPRPSSPRYCRPIRLQFLQENVESTCAEEEYIEAQIASLVSFNIVVDGKEIAVNYELVFSMVDGKVINSVTGTKSSLRCHLCNATSKDFNNIDLVIKKKVNASNLRFGISSLHAWIRFFECFLHIGYKLGIGKWQARTEDEKKTTADRKKAIQKGFKDMLGLKIDFPKQGFGSTNDGNTARRFFEDVSLSAQILGVDETLMRKCHVILQVIASGFPVNVEKFKKYCLEIAKEFVQLYPWYYMPTVIHKILIHGHQIIEWAPLPIGQLSEDAQESRNKDIKNFREGFSRKCSREKSMEDVFHRLLVSSDPLITSLSNMQPKQGKKLSSEALQLLLPPDDSAKQCILDIDNCESASDNNSD